MHKNQNVSKFKTHKNESALKLCLRLTVEVSVLVFTTP